MTCADIMWGEAVRPVKLLKFRTTNTPARVVATFGKVINKWFETLICIVYMYRHARTDTGERALP